MLSKGGGTFQKPTIIGVDDGFQSGVDQVIVGDFNGDHRSDVAAVTSSALTRLLIGAGNGTFRNGELAMFRGGESMIKLGDLNGDGKTDLLELDSLSHTAGVLLTN